MKILIYDLDDTLYDTRLLGNRNNIKYDSELYNLMNTGHPSYIYTNAVLKHALDILNRMKLRGLVKNIYYRPDELNNMKPEIRGYRMVEDGILDTENASMFDLINFYFFDDIPENLKTAKRMGWTTILINSKKSTELYIDYQYNSIKLALKDMRKKNIV